jgi:hypothetical protein
MNAVTIKSNPERHREKMDDDMLHAVEIPVLHIVYLNGVRMDAFLCFQRAQALAKQLLGSRHLHDRR